MRAQFAGRPKFASKAPQDKFVGPRAVGRYLKAAWGHFRDHSLFTAMFAYYAIVLGAFYLPVGSELMLITFAAMIALFLVAILARFTNGWRLIVIAFCHGVLVLLLVRGLEAFGVQDLSEFVLIQYTIPLPLAFAWMVDRYEHDLELLDQPLIQ
jgi:hypothetical protein